MVLIGLAASLLIAVWTLARLDRAFRPNLLAIAEMKARIMATEAINQAISSSTLGNVTAGELLEFRYDEKKSKILAVQANTVEKLKITSRAQAAIKEKLDQLNGQEIRIPMGQVLGWTLFGGFGPRFSVMVTPVGAPWTELRGDAKSVGINQSLFSIYIHSEITMKVIVPLVSRDVVVTTDNLLASALINGEIPQIYLNGITPLGFTR